MKTNRSAFTLIELLIVVAIIAILAAIAVPNFLEAQTRAKVGRVYADFRSIATALEAYRVDQTAYPPSHAPFQNLPGDDFIEPPSRRLRPLTTPMAYMTKVPGPSPFTSPADVSNPWSREWQYSTKDGLLLWSRGGSPTFGTNSEGNIQLNGFYRLAAGRAVDLSQTGDNIFRDGPAWHIMDRGPDTMYFYVWANPSWLGLTHPAQPWADTVMWYDPTNGTVSEGEIIRSQMKSSFQ
jgi:type II secretion system protein G